MLGDAPSPPGTQHSAPPPPWLTEAVLDLVQRSGAAQEAGEAAFEGLQERGRQQRSRVRRLRTWRHAAACALGAQAHASPGAGQPGARSLLPSALTWPKSLRTLVGQVLALPLQTSSTSQWSRLPWASVVPRQVVP